MSRELHWGPLFLPLITWCGRASECRLCQFQKRRQCFAAASSWPQGNFSCCHFVRSFFFFFSFFPFVLTLVSFPALQVLKSYQHTSYVEPASDTRSYTEGRASEWRYLKKIGWLSLSSNGRKRREPSPLVNRNTSFVI